MIKFCSKCGVPNPMEAAFCGKCGNPLGGFENNVVKEEIEIIEETTALPKEETINQYSNYNNYQQPRIEPMVQKSGKNYAGPVLLISIIIGILAAFLTMFVLTADTFKEFRERLESEINEETTSGLVTYGNSEYGFIKLPSDFEIVDDVDDRYDVFSEERQVYITLITMEKDNLTFNEGVDSFGTFLETLSSSNFRKQYVYGKDYDAIITFNQDNMGFISESKVYFIDGSRIGIVSVTLEPGSDFDVETYLKSYR